MCSRLEGTEPVVTGDGAVVQWLFSPLAFASISLTEVSVDVWSVGCILAEMISNRPLFPGKHCIFLAVCVILLLFFLHIHCLKEGAVYLGGALGQALSQLILFGVMVNVVAFSLLWSQTRILVTDPLVLAHANTVRLANCNLKIFCVPAISCFFNFAHFCRLYIFIQPKKWECN